MISSKLRPILPNKDDCATACRLNSSLISPSSPLLAPPQLEQNNAKFPYSGPSRSDTARQYKHTEPLAAARDRSSFLQAAWSRSVSAKRCLPVHARSRRKVDSPSTSTASEAITVAGTDRGIDGVASGSMFRFPAFADGLKHNFDAACLRFVAARFVRERRLQLFIICLPTSCYSGVVADA